jgi:hypothetical protein
MVHVEVTEARGGTRASEGRASGSSGSANVVGASAGSCSSGAGVGETVGEAEGLGGTAGEVLKVGLGGIDGVLEVPAPSFPEHAPTTKTSRDAARRAGKRRTRSCYGLPARRSGARWVA